MKQNNPCYIFGMYEPNTDFVIVNNGKNTILLIHCKECNSFVLLRPFQVLCKRKKLI